MPGVFSGRHSQDGGRGRCASLGQQVVARIREGDQALPLRAHREKDNGQVRSGKMARLAIAALCSVPSG